MKLSKKGKGNYEGADQTARMRRLVCTSVKGKLPQGRFSRINKALRFQVIPRVKKGRTNFSVTDAAALLFRLQAEGNYILGLV